MSKITDITEYKKCYGGVTLAERMEECRTSALSIALIENYEISSVYTHGVKRKTKKDKIDANTLFQAASISKPVFAVAVMRLVEQGTLDLDADIAEYLVDFDIPVYGGRRYKITLRQILCHYAGLNLHGFAGYPQNQKIPTPEQILKGELPANSLKLELIAEPGTSFSYSGGGYVLAQKIVTDVCKREFNDIMCDLVFTSFSMTRSSYLQPLPHERLGEITFGYNAYNLQIPGGYNIMPELSAAGLWTTPSELAIFGIEIMRALRGGSALLKKNTAELMTVKVYEDSPTGLGFFTSETKKGPAFGHSGSNVGYRSNMCFCPGDGTGVVVMQNSDIGQRLIGEVTQAFKEVYDW